jgi:hypothetical protein
LMAQAMAMARRSWWIDKRHVLHCYSSARADCRVTSLVDLPETSGFYDPELGRATKQINGVLHPLAERKRAGVEPSVIIAAGRPFLAWTRPSNIGPEEDGAIGPDHDPETIGKALRLAIGAGGHKRSWVMLDHKVWCYASPRGDCIVSKFWESLEADAESFHDTDLAGATLQVNAILDGLRQAKEPPGAPSFILVENALLLVWTQPAALGPDDEPEVIRHHLGLSDESGHRPMWWAGEWWNGGSYSVGAVVSYRGGAYTCVNPVDVGPNDPPTADTSHWATITPASA